jgi:selenocysteine lyase/cysteine desulfurase
LVGEAYPFAPGGRLLLTYDNHNSVNGIREFARRKGADVRYVPVTDSELRVDARLMSQALADTTPGRPHLFAFPLQSNFSGVQHPLSLVDEAQAHGFDVLVDAAAFVPTNRLDLSVVRPDFVCISFYKMFGYPTGIGALLARHKNLEALERPWFAGGTITVASVEEDGGWYRLAPGPAGFEDGTVDFLGLPAVTVGLRHLAAIGIDLIHQRVITLASWLLEVMVRLRHTNGAPLVRVFGPATMEERGATIAFLLMDPAGEPFDVPVAQEQAVGRSISLRTGCFCNPGDGEVAHHLTRDDMAPCFFTPTPLTFDQCGSLIRASTGKSPNTMRVSLGLVSDFSDLFRFVQFASAFRDRSARDVLA